MRNLLLLILCLISSVSYAQVKAQSASTVPATINISIDPAAIQADCDAQGAQIAALQQKQIDFDNNIQMQITNAQAQVGQCQDDIVSLQAAILSGKGQGINWAQEEVLYPNAVAQQ